MHYSYLSNLIFYGNYGILKIQILLYRANIKNEVYQMTRNKSFMSIGCASGLQPQLLYVDDKKEKHNSALPSVCQECETRIRLHMCEGTPEQRSRCLQFFNR